MMCIGSTIPSADSVSSLMANSYQQLLKDPLWNKKMEKWAHDTNKDDKISRVDFDLIVQRYKEIGGASDEQVKRLQEIVEYTCKHFGIADRADSISIDQLKTCGTILLKSGAIEHSFSTVFDTIDLNGDGHISPQEWTTHYRCLGIDPKHAKASFDAIDTNGDGKVSREEFIAYHVEFFGSAENQLDSAILYGPLDQVQ